MTSKGRLGAITYQSSLKIAAYFKRSFGNLSNLIDRNLGVKVP
jgi:hypothetical protein